MDGENETFVQPSPASSSRDSTMPQRAAASDPTIGADAGRADQAGEPAGVPPADSGGHVAGGASSSSAGQGSSVLGTLAAAQISPARASLVRRGRPAPALTTSTTDVPVPVPE
ncbi:hypothetical protein ACGFNU_38360 [Spirillospora sp. NPDC048911]|uniref:hypothetical protein n=1 Tax=Spirillospora sp. NPDC048911 TaxID=3364527 RepID=UPI003714FE40